MRLILFLCALALASVAKADITATYGNAAGFSMKIEIASNGDVRGEVPGRSYYFIGGQDYFVDRTDSGFVVMNVDDIAKVMAEQFTKMGKPTSRPPSLTLVPKGTVSINKWSGQAFYMQAADGQISSKPVAVISHDPALALLGRALARQVAKSEMMLGQVTGHVASTNIRQVLSAGAPIFFAGAELQSVSFDPIPKSEFALPAQPASVEEVRKRMSHQ